MNNYEEFFRVNNNDLFELNRAIEFGMMPFLVDFLTKTKMPWNSLGKPLTAFLENLIASIPQNERLRGTVSEHAVLERPESIFIGEGAQIEPHVFISGPTYIAPGAIVRQGAYVRGSVIACPHSIIGHTTEVKGSILLPHAKAAHFAYVGDSILGVEANLGAGTKLANLRFDHAQIKIRDGEQKHETGLKKMGAIIGNRAQTGCNSVTNPGTIMLPDTFIRPNSTASGIIDKKLK